MTSNFDIVIPKMVRPEDLADFLKKVYSEYKGRLFVSPKVRIMTDNVEGIIQLDIKDKAFSELRKYGSNINTLFLDAGKGPNLRIFYPPTVYGHPTISFVPSLIYSEKASEIQDAQGRLDDILSFAKLLMKHSGASYFYGGFEVLGEITDKDTADVQLIHCKGSSYKRMLQTHFENIFKVAIPERDIERIVRETAILKRDNNYTTIYFFKLGRKTEFGKHYQAVKELIN